MLCICYSESHIPTSVLQIMGEHLRAVHKRNKFISEEAVWPPNQAKLVVSVALIHYKGKRTQQELFQMATVYKEGAPAIDKLVSSDYLGPSAKKLQLDYSRVTKNIADIFAADPADLTETDSSTKAPKRILIEGAPGIGKTVLAKEIAYQWATNEILTEIKIVFLLYLRDPQLQSITTTSQLFKYMSRGCLDDEQITAFNKYFVNTDGENLCIVMDGFDEYPGSMQKCSLVLNIIKGIYMPEAIVVITSRPTATVSLHDKVDRRIDILGLPKEERDKYISETFSKSPEKKDALDKYLKQQPVINGLCFVPLHLAILLYLFQQGSLPETLTEMNESFILHTIYRHLERYGPTPSGTVDKLSKLPKQVLDYILGLSVLAFNGLQENKLVFTLEEIKQACPCFEDTKGAINGYGLLQAVEHFPHEGGAAGKATSLNFLHFTMQEFLGAFHVTNLPSEQQSSLIMQTFWDGHYNFMWMMFVGNVGIKSDVFVNFLSEGRPYRSKSEVKIANTIKNDKRKLLHVFQCFLEAKEHTEIPEVISSLFKDGKVVFNEVKLLPHNVTSLMSFICTKESVRWKNLQLQRCKIGDIGMSVLQQFISEKTSTLEYVDLRGNNSSPWGAYCAIIRHCSVDSLTLCGDQGIEDYVNEIKDCLQMNKKLISLKLCNITNNGVTKIAEAIRMNTTLQKINISNRISNDGAAPFSDSLKYDNMSINKITSEGAKYIAEAIQMNTTLEKLDLSSNAISNDGAAAISDSLQFNISLQELNMSRNEITSKGTKKISKAIQVNKTLKQLDISINKIADEGINFISDALKGDISLQQLNISHSDITNSGIKVMAEAIQMNLTLQNINISKNHISTEGLLYFMEAVKNNFTLQEVNITHNNVTKSGFTSIKQCIDSLYHRIKIIASWNEIKEEGKLITKISTSCSPDSIEEDVWSFDEYDADHLVMCLSECLKEDNTVQKVNMNRYNIDNKITSKGAIKVAEAIKMNKTLQELDISYNNISDDGAADISDALKSNNSLQILKMSSNNITVSGAIKIAEAIRVNKTLQELNIRKNNISDNGTSVISDALKSNSSLQYLDMSSNKITSEGAKLIAEAIIVNTTLRTLDLQQHDTNDAVCFNMSVLTAMHHNNTLMKLMLPYVHGDKRSVISVVEKINKERTRRGIQTLTRYYW